MNRGQKPNFGEQGFFDEPIVRVGIVEGNAAFIAPPRIDPCPVNGGFRFMSEMLIALSSS
jgi:hypothetical protein